VKQTYRDGWRVIVEIRPMATHTPISALGFEGLDGQLVGAPFEIEVAPKRLGDLGFVSMSDSLASSDVDGDYQRRCNELLAEMKKQPHVSGGRVLCEEVHVCSLCGLGWEELTAEQAADPEARLDGHSVAGEPVCCDAAIAEFRTERGIPQVVAEAGEPA
jgi:hypothetical protein